MKLSYIQLGEGEKRPVCFSLSAIEDIEDEFGSLDKMKESLLAGKVKAINKVLDIMLRAGEAYCRGMDIPCPPPLKCKPGDLVDVRDQSFVTQIFDAIKGDTERNIETQGKN